MATRIFNPNIIFPQSPFLDPLTGRPAREWIIWLQNPSITGLSLSNPLGTISGGTDNDKTPENGELLIGNGTGYTVNPPFAGSGINITKGPGTLTFSLGTSGITAGTYGSASSVGVFTVNEYGILTSAVNSFIGISASQITSGSINPSQISGSYTGITGVGVLTAGTWNATTIAVNHGGTGATTAATALTNLGAAASGANNDITSLSGLTTALSIIQGGTGATTANGARTNLGLGSGLSVTITTAKLTTLGANGSMTFTNGILTAQTAAT